MNVAEAVGRTLVRLGVQQAFGVVGSGNFHVTNALIHAGARFVATRHECGAATMADAYARTSGTVAAVTVHQGCGLTNAMTGITEAAKSRTALVVLAAETTEPRSNFYVDQDALASAVGAVPLRVGSAADAVDTATTAYRAALHDRRTMLLNLPLHVQAEDVPDETTLPDPEPTPTPPDPDAESAHALASLLATARRPVFIAGRGARTPGCRDALTALATDCGALLATSAVAKGLFHGDPWSLDVSGGFATPVAAELISAADVIVAWGCSLSMWTTRHGRLIGPDARVAQVDLDADALGATRRVELGVVGDVRRTAELVRSARTAPPATGYRTDDVARRLASQRRWRDVPYQDDSTDGRIDPRTLTIALDDILPAERVIGVDSGNFMGYPSMFLSVPDERGFCFTQAFQSIGLGLATAIGAALAQPNRLAVAALGDGGALMSAAELDTVARLGLPMVVLVYDDEAYGAEVHHFAPGGYDLGTVRFPPTDIAAVARGHGFATVTVRSVDDLGGVRNWVEGNRDRPLLVHALVTTGQPAWWLEEAFRGH